MLKKTVQYENFNGEPRSKDLYFNLTKTEIVEMVARTPNQDLSGYMENLVKSGDGSKIMDMFHWLLGLSYGEKSEDGEHFRKSPEMYEKFRQSAAYDKFFLSLISDDKKASEFVSQIIPPDMVEAVRREQAGESVPPRQPQDRQPKAQHSPQTQQSESPLLSRPPHEQSLVQDPYDHPFQGDTTTRRGTPPMPL